MGYISIEMKHQIFGVPTPKKIFIRNIFDIFCIKKSPGILIQTKLRKRKTKVQKIYRFNQILQIERRLCFSPNINNGKPDIQNFHFFHFPLILSVNKQEPWYKQKRTITETKNSFEHNPFLINVVLAETRKAKNN